MLFSVIIPAYNAESTIRKTLNSVLNQTFKDFEIVAIDDGSTDSTPTILKDYTSKDSRVHVYTFKNAGVSVSRQRGINNSNGQFIVFVDSDDTIEPELLSNLYSAIKSYPTTDLIRYQSRIIADSIAIGNPLILSPDFPLLHTVREIFISYGVPSKIIIILIYNFKLILLVH